MKCQHSYVLRSYDHKGAIQSIQHVDFCTKCFEPKPGVQPSVTEIAQPDPRAERGFSADIVRSFWVDESGVEHPL